MGLLDRFYIPKSTGLAAVVASAFLGASCGESSPASEYVGCHGDKDCHAGRVCVRGICEFPDLVIPSPRSFPTIDTRELCDGVDNNGDGKVDEMGCGSLIYMTDAFGDVPAFRLQELDLSTGQARVINSLDQFRGEHTAIFATLDSVDYRTIAITVTHSDATPDELYTVNRSDGSLRKILDTSQIPGLRYINFSPAFWGGAILFSAVCAEELCPGGQNHSQLLLAETYGGLSGKLMPSIVSGGDEYDPAVSHNYVAFSVLRGGFKLGLYEAHEKTFRLVPVDGDYSFGGIIRWDSERRRMLFGDWPTGSIYAIGVEGGVPELLERRVVGTNRFDLSPDGTKLAFFKGIGAGDGYQGFCVRDLQNGSVSCWTSFSPGTGGIGTFEWVE